MNGCSVTLGYQNRFILIRELNSESQLLQELCALLGVQKTHTTPYHTQANAIAERNNRGL